MVHRRFFQGRQLGFDLGVESQIGQRLLACPGGGKMLEETSACRPSADRRSSGRREGLRPAQDRSRVVRGRRRRSDLIRVTTSVEVAEGLLRPLLKAAVRMGPGRSSRDGDRSNRRSPAFVRSSRNSFSSSKGDLKSSDTLSMVPASTAYLTIDISSKSHTTVARKRSRDFASRQHRAARSSAS